MDPEASTSRREADDGDGDGESQTTEDENIPQQEDAYMPPRLPTPQPPPPPTNVRMKPRYKLRFTMAGVHLAVYKLTASILMQYLNRS